MLWGGSAVIAGLGGRLAGGTGGRFYGGGWVGAVMAVVSPVFTYFLLTRVWVRFLLGGVGIRLTLCRSRECRCRRGSMMGGMVGGRTMRYGRRIPRSSGRSCFEVGKVQRRLYIDGATVDVYTPIRARFILGHISFRSKNNRWVQKLVRGPSDFL